MNIRNKSILVTGGTGSFGKEFLQQTIKNLKSVKKLIIYSRDELKQYELSKVYSEKKYPFLRYFIGDVRDAERVNWALKDVDIVVHAAALKQVPAAEYNPIEAIKTNILGAQNIIEASLKNNVQKVVALSTDKASSPINLYGATKLCSDKLFTAANNFKGRRKISFSVVRYGNVFGSRGSVIHNFLHQKKTGVILLTNQKMTRFIISLQDGVKLVYWTIKNSFGGEIIVPRIPSLRIIDLAKVVSPKSKYKVIGARPGEKLHEDLISSNESRNTLIYQNKYIIFDPLNEKIKKFYTKKGGRKVKENFKYDSFTNKDFLLKKQIEKIVFNFIKNFN
jgi:UDP-N-acetylglucosamine 4,6-dehydratase (inverting)|tara:strand:- start:5802 stop:6806 length:1005 start_codon:yes stop_codon:yes gene_type:complete